MALILVVLGILLFFPGLFVGSLKLLLVLAALCFVASPVTWQRR